MGATANSPYQKLRTQHIAGVPPGADLQRSTEVFSQYQARMAALYLPPDIGATESDVEYAARLASYLPLVPTSNVTASYALTSLTAATATSASYAASASLVHSSSIVTP